MSYGAEYVVLIGETQVCTMFQCDEQTFDSSSSKHPFFKGVPTMYKRVGDKIRVWPNPAADCRVMKLVPAKLEGA